ncbi:hypothetical protein UL54_11465, partial [Shigella dysenteriae]
TTLPRSGSRVRVSFPAPNSSLNKISTAMRYCWFSLSLTNSCKQSYPQPQAVILISKKLRTVNSIFLTY